MPLYALFTSKGKLAQDVWLRMWQTDIPPANEISTQLSGLNIPSIEKVKARMATNHVYIVADRVVDGMVEFVFMLWNKHTHLSFEIECYLHVCWIVQWTDSSF